MALNSKLSRNLANVREQLKKRTTRGSNPRPLSSDELRILIAKYEQLKAEMKEAKGSHRVIKRGAKEEAPPREATSQSSTTRHEPESFLPQQAPDTTTPVDTNSAAAEAKQST